MTRKTLTPTQQAHLDFWAGFHAYATRHARRIRPVAPQPDTWMGMAIGKTGFRLVAFAATKNWDGAPESEIRASLAVASKDAEQHFALLKKQRDTIQSEFGEKLDWIIKPDTHQRTIHLRRAVDCQRVAAREDCYRWLVEKLDRLHEVFQLRIGRLP